MSAWKYKRILPKVTVDKLRLIDKKRLINLVGLDLPHISSVLEKTPYGAELSEALVCEIGSRTLEDALLKNFVRTCEELRELSPKAVRLLISGLLMKFEVNCIKLIIRAKEAGLSVDEAMGYVFPVGRLDKARCKEILETSESIEDVIGVLSDGEYGLVLENVFEAYLEKKNIYLLEVALDKHVYSKMWQAVGKLWGLDRKIAKTVVGLEIDSVNIKTILRCKSTGLKEHHITPYLIPTSHVFGMDILKKAIRCPDIQSTINLLVEWAKQERERDYQYVLQDLQDADLTSLTALETTLDRGLLKTNLRIKKRYTPFFNIGLLLTFLNLKWFEVKNLRAIIKGSDARIAPNNVKKLLILEK